MFAVARECLQTGHGALRAPTLALPPLWGEGNCPSLREMVRADVIHPVGVCRHAAIGSRCRIPLSMAVEVCSMFCG